MGKGDKKTAKGKRAMGSYGKTRKRNSDKPVVTSPKAKKPKAEKPKVAKKAAPAKKASEPKTTATKKASAE